MNGVTSGEREKINIFKNVSLFNSEGGERCQSATSPVAGPIDILLVSAVLSFTCLFSVSEGKLAFAFHEF